MVLKILLLSLSLFSLFAGPGLNPAFAVGPPDPVPAVNPNLIEGQYNVKFKDRTILLEPDFTLKDRPDFIPPVAITFTGYDSDKRRIEAILQVNGEVVNIFESINAVSILMDVQEAERLSHNPHVEYVEQVVRHELKTVQPPSPNVAPGWALDRMDQTGVTTYTVDSFFHWWDTVESVVSERGSLNTYCPTGGCPSPNEYYFGNNNTLWYNDALTKNQYRSLYILDTGVNYNNTNIWEEFKDPISGAARVATGWWGSDGVWYVADYNTVKDGLDCYGHGTSVTDAAVGKIYGVAKRIFVRSVKISSLCTGAMIPNANIQAFDWLAKYGGNGSVVNYSWGDGTTSCNDINDLTFANAVKVAYQNGIIPVMAAGNENCDVSHFTVGRMTNTAFVVGATNHELINGVPRDARASGWPNGQGSNWGTNVDVWAPGDSVYLYGLDGTVNIWSSGTSYAAPYVAGVFARLCQTTIDCVTNSQTSRAALETRFKSIEFSTNSVVRKNGVNVLMPACTSNPSSTECGNQKFILSPPAP